MWMLLCSRSGDNISCRPPARPRAPVAALQGWGENDRGVSYTFGPDSVTEFLQKHDLDLICRAHQVGRLLWARMAPVAVAGTAALLFEAVFLSGWASRSARPYL